MRSAISRIPTFTGWTLDALRDEAMVLSQSEHGIKWARGRVLDAAQREHGDDACGELMDELADTFGLSFTTLNQERWVASHYSSNSQIHDELTWTHHRLVAAIEPSERAHLLMLAVKEGMNVAAFRAFLEARENRQPLPFADPVEMDRDAYVFQRAREAGIREDQARQVLRFLDEWERAQMGEVA